VFRPLAPPPVSRDSRCGSRHGRGGVDAVLDESRCTCFRVHRPVSIRAKPQNRRFVKEELRRSVRCMAIPYSTSIQKIIFSGEWPIFSQSFHFSRRLKNPGLASGVSRWM
jgi:hypothetical protein